MRMKKPLSMSFVALLLLSIATVMVPLSVSADEHPAQAIWVDPGSYLTAPELDNLTECDTFTVDVMINVTDPDPLHSPPDGLFGFDYHFKWDATIINLTSYTIHIPPEWTSYFKAADKVEDHNATHKVHWLGVAALSPSTVFTGVMSICTYTFHVNYQPHYPEPDYIGSLDIYDDKLADDRGDPIVHTTYDGQYRIPRPPIYSLEITTEGGGTTDPTPGTYIYEANSTVQVTAIPYFCHLFDHWELDGFNVGSANPYSVLMDDNHTLHAVFVAGIHDVAITNVTPSKTIVGQGYSTPIKVTVENQGDCPQAFDVTTYYDDTPIETKTVTYMPPGEETTITFTWNTTGVPYGNYTISANVTIVPGETDTDDNSYTDGTVRVNMPGDIKEEFGIVDIYDLVYVAVRYGSEKGKPPPPGTQPYEPNADINGDDIIDIYDVVIIGIHYGETYP